MTQGVYLCIGKEAGMADRGAVIDDMYQCVVFVYNGGIVDVDESVHASRKQAGWVGRVELKLKCIF